MVATEPGFRIVSEQEAVELTGQEASRLRAVLGVQELTRVYPDGSRVPSLRFPTDVLDYLRKER